MITVCIGDSIVNGYPFLRQDSWPALLEHSIAAKSTANEKAAEEPEREYFINRGVDGETTSEIMRRFRRDVLCRMRNYRCASCGAGESEYIESEIGEREHRGSGHGVREGGEPAEEFAERVIISAGTNDFIFTGTKPEEAADTIAAMARLFLDEKAAEAGGQAQTRGKHERETQTGGAVGQPEEVPLEKTGVVLSGKPGVVLLSPILCVPEMARESWADGTDYDAVNRKLLCLRERLMDFAEQTAGVAFIDLQTGYKEWASQVGNSAAYTDGIHPTKQGYRRIAAIMEMELTAH